MFRWLKLDRKKMGSDPKKDVLLMPTMPRPHFGDPEELGIQQKKPYRFGNVPIVARGLGAQRETHLQ